MGRDGLRGTPADLRGMRAGGTAVRWLGLAAGAMVVAATIGACAPPTAAPGAGDGGVSVGPPQTVIVHGAAPVDVALTDSGPSGPMGISSFESSAPAGNVTFRVKNLGTMDHEMIILKTDTPYDQLPVTDAGDPPAPVKTGADKVDETSNVGETGDPNLKPGDTRTFTVKLDAGKYVLVCNLAGHYQMGMRAPFTVTPSGQAAAPSSINVQLSDQSGMNGPMAVTPSSYVAAAGNVTFVVKNTGSVEHEMIVLKTDTPFDQLPVVDAGDPPAAVTTGADKVDEASNVGETGDPNLKPGDTRTFTVKLDAGKYVLVCNLAGHYQMGMRAPLTVVAPDQPPPSTVNVALSDQSGVNGPMAVTPSSYVAAAGNVTFVVKNTGSVEHEMIVLKTDTPFDQLPVVDAGDPPAAVTTGADKVDEASNVGETGDPNLKPGDTRTFTVKLDAGKYVLVCNLAGHYQMGMRAPFTVQ